MRSIQSSSFRCSKNRRRCERRYLSCKVASGSLAGRWRNLQRHSVIYPRTSASKAQPATVQSPMQVTSSVLVQHNTGSSIPSTPHHRRISTSATDSTSLPLAATRVASGTRLPYPQGDYTSPPDAFSPPNSPLGSLTKRAHLQTRFCSEHLSDEYLILSDR
ncbi:hypothetical protein BDN70DRAFT_238750 [Pholiota conissans]|uniref:Uncharacterized protein n=1 Tax=Pholiota conissans TaxID=109636 RepID=A0A9P5ZEZ7_9AGAR|nr:hypothetical protein BDN70DRAFT_238750 [Pholiota conissans]